MGLLGKLTGADKAAEEQKKIAMRAAANQERLMREGAHKAEGRLSPFDVGDEVMSQYMIETGVRPGQSKFEMSPMWQNMLEESLRGVETSAAGMGGLYSGRTIQDLYDVGAQTTLGAYNQYMGGLGDVVDLGYGAAGNLANVDMGLAGGLGGIEAQRANALSQHSKAKQASRMGDLKLGLMGLGALGGGLGMMGAGGSLMGAGGMGPPQPGGFGFSGAGGGAGAMQGMQSMMPFASMFSPVGGY
jgi:hypothetical protein